MISEMFLGFDCQKKKTQQKTTQPWAPVQTKQSEGGKEWEYRASMQQRYWGVGVRITC